MRLLVYGKNDKPGSSGDMLFRMLGGITDSLNEVDIGVEAVDYKKGYLAIEIEYFNNSQKEWVYGFIAGIETSNDLNLTIKEIE